jgi:3-oxoadipate CoA-transferase alpha subunit
MAADLTIVETEAMVELGSLDPEAVVTPGIFVDRIVEVGPLPPRNHPMYAKLAGAAA